MRRSGTSRFPLVAAVALLLVSVVTVALVYVVLPALSPFVLPGLICVWTLLLLILTRRVSPRTLGLNAFMWITFALGLVINLTMPAWFSLWSAGIYVVWVIAALTAFLWPRPQRTPKAAPSPARFALDEGPVVRLIAREGRLFQQIKLGEDAWDEEELNIAEWKERQAELHVWADTAVVVDKEGANMRVLRRSAKPRVIHKGETIRAVVDLRPQARVQQGVIARTRDGIVVKTDLFMTFQIERNGMPSVQDPYPVLDDAIIRAVYGATVSGGRQSRWDVAPMLLLSGRLRDLIGMYAFSDLYEYDEGDSRAPRQRIGEQLITPEILINLRRQRGINLLWAGIGNIESPDEEIQDEIRRQWKRQRAEALNQEMAPVASRRRAEDIVTIVNAVKDTLYGQRAAGKFVEIDLDEVVQTEKATVYVAPAEVLDGLQALAERVAQGPLYPEDETLQDLLIRIRFEQDQLRKALEQGRFVPDGFEDREEAARIEAIDLQRQLVELTAQASDLRRERDRVYEQMRSVLLGFIEVFDIVDMAVQRTPDADFAADRYALGIRVIQQDMLRRFEQLGLEEVPVKAGDGFDPHAHEAIETDPTSALPDGAVSRVIRRGFYLRASSDRRLIRPAQVAVAAPPGAAVRASRQPAQSPAPGPAASSAYTRT